MDFFGWMAKEGLDFTQRTVKHIGQVPELAEAGITAGKKRDSQHGKMMSTWYELNSGLLAHGNSLAMAQFYIVVCNCGIPAARQWLHPRYR
jgi:hypothetical protein